MDATTSVYVLAAPSSVWLVQAPSWDDAMSVKSLAAPLCPINLCLEFDDAMTAMQCRILGVALLLV